MLDTGAVMAGYDTPAQRHRQEAKRSMLEAGSPVPAPQLDPPHVDGGVLLADAGQKVSSPELATLAAKYVSMTDEGFETRLLFDDGFVRSDYAKELLRDVRALAASVLAQAQ